MEEARAEILDNLRAKELQQELKEDDRNSEVRVDLLKAAINNLLLRHLPIDLTIMELEAIALGIFTIITEPRRFLK
jgi:hypothetical protein